MLSHTHTCTHTHIHTHTHTQRDRWRDYRAEGKWFGFEYEVQPEEED
jgi:hypothetical protein